MTPTATTEQIVREVVRGERPWTDLQTLGMEIHAAKGEADSPRPLAAKLDIHDLARGFIANRHDRTALRAWAFAMEALDADFEGVVGHPSGEAIWDAIWAASFGDPVQAAQVQLIEKLAGERTDLT